MSAADIKRTKTRFPEIILAITAMCAFTAFAHCTWMGAGGDWISQNKLLHAFSSRVPEWVSWDLGGARTMVFTANPLFSWLLCAVYSASVWLAGCRSDRLLRPLWLLTALLGALAFIGAGDISVAVISTASLTLVWVLMRYSAEPESDNRMIRQTPGLKSIGTAATLGMLAFIGIELIWQTSFANGANVFNLPLLGCFGSTLASIVIVLFITRIVRHRPVLSGTLMSAVLSAIWYMGPGTLEFTSAWNARGVEVARITESGRWKELRRELNKTRLSEREASVQRLPRPEVNSLWKLREGLGETAQSLGNEGRIATAWLAADEALYSGKTGVEREKQRTAALEQAVTMPAGSFAEEIKGWLYLDATGNASARIAFLNAIRLRPEAPMTWLGLALAESALGNDEAASGAFANWCLLDPRGIFSPAWSRRPMSRHREESLRRWSVFVTTPAFMKRLSKKDSERLLKFEGWLVGWRNAGGNVEKFLEDKNTPIPSSSAVRLIRERIREVLKTPVEMKAGAVLSAGATLLAERHLNVGQCKEIFETLRGGSRDSRLPAAAIRISRPLMSEWADSCRITEGGVGATLHDFEEDLVLKILTYGQEAAPIELPAEWLQSQLPRP